MSQHPDHFLLICTTCAGPKAAARMRAALAPDLPEGFAIRPVDCMAGCDHPVTVGFQAPGKASYLFGPITGDADMAGVAEFAHQYAAHETGWTSASDRPQALYHKTLARLPWVKAREAAHA